MNEAQLKAATIKNIVESVTVMLREMADWPAAKKLDGSTALRNAAEATEESYISWAYEDGGS